MFRILIADDSYIMRNNLKEIFKSKGYKVVAEATNGKEACHYFDEFTPDLVTMDINMPVMNGIEAVKEIKSKHPGAKIIMVSAENQKGLLFEALKAGAVHYIVKPIVTNKVLTIVDEVRRQK